ncbi:MAG: transcriptional regulator [Actinobacteria bacterium HGW-Actinobacteria-10]|jgi:DNA-binding transcriptional ArsR family regulator|nr:MAG: transcriptional regulator [Actinobacteria bacterium HGW-Actinobacteria-10]
MGKQADSPVCEVECVHADKVDELRPVVGRLTGVGEAVANLADDTRFKVLYALSQSELCVCDVAAVVGATTAATSYHLRLLYRTGLVDYRRDGRLVYYRLAEDKMRPVLEAIKSYVLTTQVP